MPDAKEKMVSVEATAKGQWPDFTWAKPGDVRAIPESLVSREWMKPAPGEKAEKAAPKGE